MNKYLFNDTPAQNINRLLGVCKCVYISKSLFHKTISHDYDDKVIKYNTMLQYKELY